MLVAAEGPVPESLDQSRGGVAPGDVDALASLAVVLPLDADAVGGVLGADAQYRRYAAGSNLVEAEIADAADGDAVDGSWFEWRREQGRQRHWLDPKIEEDSTPDDCIERRKQSHTLSSG